MACAWRNVHSGDDILLEIRPDTQLNMKKKKREDRPREMGTSLSHRRGLFTVVVLFSKQIPSSHGTPDRIDCCQVDTDDAIGC